MDQHRAVSNVKVQQLENQDAAAKRIEHHKNTNSAALQEIEEAEVSRT